MGLISAIKSALGLDDSSDRSGGRSRGTDVTVEREADATTERAVKESDADATDASGNATGTTGDQGATATGTGGTAEPEDDGAAEGEAVAADAGDAGGGEPVDGIKGIGPAYADRLAEAGIHTVSDLAEADAADVDEATGIGENRIRNWIERANAR